MPKSHVLTCDCVGRDRAKAFAPYNPVEVELVSPGRRQARDGSLIGASIQGQLLGLPSASLYWTKKESNLPDRTVQERRADSLVTSETESSPKVGAASNSATGVENKERKNKNE